MWVDGYWHLVRTLYWNSYSAILLVCSVLVHSGGVHGGHYYAYIRPTLSDQWYAYLFPWFLFHAVRYILVFTNLFMLLLSNIALLSFEEQFGINTCKSNFVITKPHFTPFWLPLDYFIYQHFKTTKSLLCYSSFFAYACWHFKDSFSQLLYCVTIASILDLPSS